MRVIFVQNRVRSKRRKVFRSGTK